MEILVADGAGLILGNCVLQWLAEGDEPVENLDKLTYAGILYAKVSQGKLFREVEVFA